MEKVKGRLQIHVRKLYHFEWILLLLLINKFTLLEKNYLKIVRQFRTSCITRIHGNSYKTVWIEFKFCPFKNKHFQLLLNGSLNTKDLLSYYRQHFQLNSIKFIKASPSTRRSQSFKKLRTRKREMIFLRKRHHLLKQIFNILSQK